MSGECDQCSEHSLDCKCNDNIKLPTPAKGSTKLKRLKKAGLVGMKEWKEMVELEEKDLLELIYWARRYCDGRATYAPSRFNWLYDNIVHLIPKVKEKDQFDHTLTDKGKYWPYAQDGMFKEETGTFDARPMKPNEDGWIKFSERMPKHNSKIYVKSDNLWRGEGIFQDGKFVYSKIKGACFGNPTHWKLMEKKIEHEENHSRSNK